LNCKRFDISVIAQFKQRPKELSMILAVNSPRPQRLWT
jgi:hypothetical protein